MMVPSAFAFASRASSADGVGPVEAAGPAGDPAGAPLPELGPQALSPRRVTPPAARPDRFRNARLLSRDILEASSRERGASRIVGRIVSCVNAGLERSPADPFGQAVRERTVTACGD